MYSTWQADWLVRKVTSDTQKRRTFGHYFPLTGNRMKPLNSFQFLTSLWWNYLGFQWDEIIRCVISTGLLSVQGSDVNPELTWTIIRQIHWIATIMHTVRNTETFCRCQGGGGENAGRICRPRVAVLISSCIERTQDLGCEFEIFTMPKFPASWNCGQPGEILTFSRNQCRSLWNSTPEDSRRHSCNFGHPA